MRRKPWAWVLLLAALIQLLPAAAYAYDDTYIEDHLYYHEIQRLDGLFEEETIKFDYFTPRATEPGETLKQGIDVSYYQNLKGEINWDKVKADGIDFVFVRVAYRGYGTGRIVEDSHYKVNIEGAMAAGLQVGVYIFSQAITPEEGREEAQFLIDRVGEYNLELPLIMDYEYAGSSTGRLYEAKLSREEATACYQAFRDTAAAQGYQSAVYANKNFLNKQLVASGLDNVWLAHYTTETDYAGDYDFWQCTSSGSVEGIVGLMDLDFWFDDGCYSAALPFRDLSIDHWGYGDIRYAYEQGLFKGKGTESQFAPGDVITRAEMAVLLHRLAGSPKVTAQHSFMDLEPGSYYLDAVAWAHATGVFRGRSETEFDPGAAITRQELVSVLYRYAGEPESGGNIASFIDAGDVMDFAVNAMVWAVEKGIIHGNDESRLIPTGGASRAETAVVLARYVKLMNKAALQDSSAPSYSPQYGM